MGLFTKKTFGSYFGSWCLAIWKADTRILPLVSFMLPRNCKAASHSMHQFLVHLVSHSLFSTLSPHRIGCLALQSPQRPRLGSLVKSSFASTVSTLQSNHWSPSVLPQSLYIGVSGTCGLVGSPDGEHEMLSICRCD